jgi:hypothetical protein
MSPAQKKGERGRRPAEKLKKRQRRAPAPTDKSLAYSIPYAGSLIGLSRQSSYNAAKQGLLPTIWINGRCLVPRIPFEKKFGATADANA